MIFDANGLVLSILGHLAMGLAWLIVAAYNKPDEKSSKTWAFLSRIGNIYLIVLGSVHILWALAQGLAAIYIWSTFKGG